MNAEILVIDLLILEKILFKLYVYSMAFHFKDFSLAFVTNLPFSKRSNDLAIMKDVLI